MSNGLAKLAITGCARLHGISDITPDNPAVHKSLCAMLTPYLTRKLSDDCPPELLKILNSNTENPYLIWDNATRAELLEFLTDQQEKKIKTVRGRLTALSS